jgi:RecG-like helicase
VAGGRNVTSGSGRTLVQLAGLGVDVLDGVGPARASALAELGVVTVADLLTFYPRKYIDRTRQVPIGQLRADDEATVLGTVTASTTRTTRSRKRMVVVTVGDGTGDLSLTFFNQPWRQRQLAVGTDVVLFGKVQRFRGQRQMTNPVVDLVGDQTGRVVPVYPQSGKAGITTAEVARLVAEALRRWKAAGLGLAVYSSGSTAAQQLLYSHSNAGDLSTMFSHWFDTRMGPKHQSESYAAIATRMELKRIKLRQFSNGISRLAAFTAPPQPYQSMPLMNRKGT